MFGFVKCVKKFFLVGSVSDWLGRANVNFYFYFRFSNFFFLSFLTESESLADTRKSLVTSTRSILKLKLNSPPNDSINETSNYFFCEGSTFDFFQNQ
jgi:hypothetical protein